MFANFVEQPHIFYRNHRLVSERVDQLNLLFGKSFDPLTRQNKNSNWRAFAQQRNGEQSSHIRKSWGRPYERQFGICGHILDVYGLPGQQGSAGQ